MKHYLGKITERNGDFEYTTEFLFSTKGSPDKYINKQVKEWRGCTKDDWDKELMGYWSDHTLIWASGYTNVPEADFVVLSKYIPIF